MITKFTTKYGNNICDTFMNQWASVCKREEDKSIVIFERKKERKKDCYLNNATAEFCSKDRDESNPEEKGKHGEIITKFPDTDDDARRNRNRSSSEGKKENTKSGKHGTPPTHETEYHTGKVWPKLDK